MLYDLIEFKYIKFNKKNDDQQFKQITLNHWNYFTKNTQLVSNFNFIQNLDYFFSSTQTSLPIINYANSNLIESINSETNQFEILTNSSTLYSNNNIEEFFYLKKLTFINFFINNMIDVPICFKKSKSLKSKNFELPLLKFSNFLMKKGKKEKINRIIFKTLQYFINDLKLQNQSQEITLKISNWQTFHYLFNNVTNLFLINTIKLFYLENNLNPLYPYTSFITNNTKYINKDFSLKNTFLIKLSQLSPIFSYFIYSVDKNVRKFSRGKSGKYVFVWKYISSYKRLYLAMRLIAKDIKFSNNKTINERLTKTLTNLNNNLNKTLLWKSKIFSHNYVFKNFRKTLMTSLKTST